MAVLNVLLANSRDRELLHDELGEEHSIAETTPGSGEEPVDLHVLDEQALERHHETLADEQTDVEPVFLPVLLVVRRHTPDDLPEAVWMVVDEVINAPVGRAELDTRVGSLLRQRRQSLELKHAKERSEVRLQAVFDTAPDPVVVVQPDGTVTEANEAFGTLFGVDPATAVGERLREIGTPEAEQAERVFLTVGKKAESPTMETIEWTDRDDAVQVVEMHVDTVAASADISERVGIFRDVSERVRRERQLREQNERLERFAKTLAHDLRNPLSIAQGSLQQARQTGNESDFEGVAEGLDRMEQLIEELLEMVREGQLVLDPAPVEIRAAAQQAWQTVNTADATLTITAKGEVLADQSRLCELFENLFRNAVEHVGDDVQVRVGWLQENDTDGFFVEDDGHGIPLGDADMAFEAGYTTHEDGTGFGLRIVKEIAAGHGWTVTLNESETGGTRFEFTNVDIPE